MEPTESVAFSLTCHDRVKLQHLRRVVRLLHECVSKAEEQNLLFVFGQLNRPLPRTRGRYLIASMRAQLRTLITVDNLAKYPARFYSVTGEQGLNCLQKVLDQFVTDAEMGTCEVRYD